MKKILFAFVALSLFGCASSISKPDIDSQPDATVATARQQVDDYFFPTFYWGQPLKEVVELLGSPVGEPSTHLERKGYFFRGISELALPNAISASFGLDDAGLRSLQLFFITEHLDEPELYRAEYDTIEGFLQEAYGDTVRFDWFSPQKEPEFSGREIMDQLLTMITIRKAGESGLAHSILFAEGHINHTLGFWDLQTQSIEETVEIYGEESTGVLLEGVRNK